MKSQFKFKVSVILVICIIIISLISYDIRASREFTYYNELLETNEKVSNSTYLLIIPETVNVPNTAFDKLEHAYCGSYRKLNNHIYVIENKFKELQPITQTEISIMPNSTQLAECDFFIHTHPTGACLYSGADIKFNNIWNFELTGLFCPQQNQSIKFDKWFVN